MLRKITGFLADRSANVALIFAITLPAVVGFCGLGGETALWYFKQRDLQGAVDVAAYNGAIALRGGATQSAITTQASTDATRSGWDSAGTLVVHTPPTSGTHQISRAVEVILTESEPRYFTALFNSRPVVIRTRAVAVYNDLGYACLLALNKSASAAVKFWGNSSSTFTDCNVYSDSISPTGFQQGGSSQASMPCALSAGGFSVSSGLTVTSCSAPVSNAAEVPDPYASLAAPPIPNNCTNGNSSSLSAGKYCNGLSLNGTTTLAPGVYVISGGTLKINANANISGSGVTFYLTNGATVSMNGNSTVNLSAPTSGTYSGILFYGDRTQANNSNTINGNASSSMTGAVYFPSQAVSVLGNFSGANGCMQVVADTISYSGNAHFSTNCSAYGLPSVSTPGAVALVE
ncbi:MAG TPA: hypothetical protein VGH02_03025 [Rhizomicrobium sp.]